MSKPLFDSTEFTGPAAEELHEAQGLPTGGKVRLRLPQRDQVQMRMQAFWTGFAQAAEGRQVHRIVAIGMIDHDMRIEFGEQEAIVGVLGLTATVDRMGQGRAGRCFKG